ncbi:MAG: hypothetical protein PHI35_05595 [Victivallaceae bacterium]|nr:hypothetical protein [Victivallaceae bacterium]
MRAGGSKLDSALKRREAARSKIRRYWHTRSFNNLAGRSSAPAERRKRDRTPLYRILLVVLAIVFWAVGLFFVFRKG